MLLVTPDDHVLLMSMAFPWVDSPVWIAPGGGLQAEESWAEAAVRELREETGFIAQTIGKPVWERYLDINHDQQVTRLHERYFVVQSARFEPSELRHEPVERAWFREFRWWPVAALAEDDAVEAGAMLQTVIRQTSLGGRHGMVVERQ